MGSSARAAIFEGRSEVGLMSRVSRTERRSLKERHPTLIFALCATARRDDSGQDLAEYALLVALIAMVVLAAVTLLSESIQAVFDYITELVR